MTQQRTFTDSYIRSLKPKAAPYKLSEAASRGEGRLVVRVQPDGAKEFFYRVRHDGIVNKFGEATGETTFALGRYDAQGNAGKTLKQIRLALKEKRALRDKHGDLRAWQQTEARAKQLERRKGSLAQLLDAYAQHLEKSSKASAKSVAALFERHVIKPFPVIARTPAKNTLPGDIQTILARMVNLKLRREVNKARSYLSAAFSFAAKADNDPRTMARDGVKFGLTINPVKVVPVIPEYENTRERNLSDDELRAFWKALDALPVVQRATLRFNVALACQRPTQLLRADWTDIDSKENTLLLRDSKGRGGSRDHLLPLTSFALEQLRPLQDQNAKAETPFTSDGKRRLTLDTLSWAVSDTSKALLKSDEIPAFQLRDLRRTAETMLQRLGVDKEVRAHLLSHGRTTGVQGKHYERYNFLNEKRSALEKWARELQRIIEGKTADVVKLRA